MMVQPDTKNLLSWFWDILIQTLIMCLHDLCFGIFLIVDFSLGGGFLVVASQKMRHLFLSQAFQIFLELEYSYVWFIFRNFSPFGLIL